MKKLLLLALVMLGGVVNVSAYDITFYYAVDASTVGSYSVKLNKNSGNGWGLYDMTKTDKTINGRYIYSCTYTDTSDKLYDIQIQFHNESGWVSQVVALQNNSGEDLSNFNGKMYVHKDNDNKGWTIYNYDTAAKSITIHCKKTAAWTPIYGYAFYHNGLENVVLTNGWTGNSTSTNTNNTDYYDLTISSSVNSVSVIFNNGYSGAGTNQTWDIGIGSNTEYWTYGDEEKGGNAAGAECWAATTNAPDGWVGYTRSVTSGNYGTICLPYAATITGADIYTISSTLVVNEDLKGINISPVEGNTIEAGKAYIFKATSTTLTATYSGSYTEASAGYGMMGNISSTAVTLDGSEGYYVIKDNKIHKVVEGEGATGVKIGQYKGYITLEDIDTATSRGANFISFDDDETTGINNLSPALSRGEGVAYDLQGRRVAQLTKGLYIVNGKKVVK